MSSDQLTLFPGGSPVSPTPRQEDVSDTKMTETSGRKCGDLLKSSTPAGSLVRMLLDSPRWFTRFGSLQWKCEQLPDLRTTTFTRDFTFEKRLCSSTTSVRNLKKSVTRSSRLRFRLLLSERLTEEQEYGLWRTPTVDEPGVPVERLVDKDGNPPKERQRMYDKENGRHAQYGLTQQVKLRMMPTPTAGDAKASGSRSSENNNAHTGVSLTDFVRGGTTSKPREKLWPTPRSTDGDKGIRTPEGARKEAQRTRPDLPTAAIMFPTPLSRDGKGSSGRAYKGERKDLTAAATMFPTPKASKSGPDYARAGRSESGGHDLQTFVSLMPTPTSRDWKDTPGMAQQAENPDGSSRNRNDQLARRVYSEASGQIGGQLNCHFVEWLMGYPPNWTRR